MKIVSIHIVGQNNETCSSLNSAQKTQNIGVLKQFKIHNNNCYVHLRERFNLLDYFSLMCTWSREYFGSNNAPPPDGLVYHTIRTSANFIKQADMVKV